MGLLSTSGLLGRRLIPVALVAVVMAIASSGKARVVLFIVALSIAITGLALIGVGWRLGMLSVLNRRLRRTGVAGTAVITSLGDTGVAINNSPVIEFGLDVDTPTHPSYATTIRQRVPRLAMGTFPLGSTVSVVVDPTSRDRLAIDWDAGIERAVPPAAATTEVTAVAETVRDVDDLLRTGRSAAALVTSMEDAGDMSELGMVEIGSADEDDRLFIIGLEVMQPGLDPYEVRIAHRVPERLVGRVGPRTRVDVAVDRNDDHAVAIDWESLRK